MRQIILSSGKTLSCLQETTHRTYYVSLESRAASLERDEYITRQIWQRSDGPFYAVMAFARCHGPRRREPIWGVYRGEEWPGAGYYAEGNFTLLQGDIPYQEAFHLLPELAEDDPGHQHSYWVAKTALERYRQGSTHYVTAHCHHCHMGILHTEQTLQMLNAGKVEVVDLLAKGEE